MTAAVAEPVELQRRMVDAVMADDFVAGWRAAVMPWRSSLGVIVTAACNRIPCAWVAQTRAGGSLSRSACAWLSVAVLAVGAE